ncbi:MAG TPA: cytochrome c [Candidatus Tectomicrobia bacterium]
MITMWHMQRSLLFALVYLAIPLAGAWAQSDEAFIQYRQKVMLSQSASMGAIGDIMKNKLPYSDHILSHALDMQRMSKLINEAFKKEITAGKTDAKPALWKEWDKFTAAVQAFEQESGKLAEVAAQSSDLEVIGAQVKKVGDACSNCHKPYRKPKEESYKNKP